MIAVKLGNTYVLQKIIAKMLHTTIEDNQAFDNFETLWGKLSNAQLIKTQVDPDRSQHLRFLTTIYYATFDKDEDAAEFKLRYL